MVKKTSKKKVAEAETPRMQVIVMAEVNKRGTVGKPKAYAVIGQSSVPQKKKRKRRRA